MVAIAAEETPNVTDVTTAVATIELEESNKLKSAESTVAAEQKPNSEEIERDVDVNAGKKYADWSSTLIGEGAFGSVLLVVNDEGRRVAVKRIPVKYDSAVKQTIEYDFMEEVKGHVNVVQPFGMELEGSDFIHISMEYVCYDLFYLIDYLNHGNVRQFFRHLMEGIKHIHSKGIAHRDIKPENLLINEHFVLKITDFGLAERFRDEQNNEILLKGTAGSSPYISPEGRGDGEFRAEPHDIFACGVVLVFLLTKNTHWEKADPVDDLRYKKFLRGAMYQEKAWKAMQGSVLNLLKRLLKDNPQKRANIEEVLRCGWLAEEEERPNWDKLRNGILKVYATPIPNEKRKENDENQNGKKRNFLNPQKRFNKKKGKR